MAFIKTKLAPIKPDDLYNTLRLTYGFNDDEQQKKPGILAKPATPASDADVVAAGFFNYMLTKSKERAAKLRAEAIEQYSRDSAEEAARLREILGITSSKVPESIMTASETFDATIPTPESEPVIEGVPEKPEMGSREPFELVVDTIGNEALDRDATRLVDVTDTEEGKLTNVKPLEKLSEEIDPGTIDTKPLDADGVQPTNGKGLMSQTHREVTLEEVPSNIDTVFLGQQEGSAKTKAYIPKKDGKVLDKSGVTIGTGVDLGSKDKAYFRYLKDPDLVAKLEPYFGKKKDAAVTALKDNPLTLSKDEVAKLDAYVKKLEFRTLKNKWNTDSSVKWEELPSGKATAVASVYYQYGPAVFNHNFWTQTTSGQWQQAYDNLMNYGDKYSSRRKREAAVLKKAL